MQCNLIAKTLNNEIKKIALLRSFNLFVDQIFYFLNYFCTRIINSTLTQVLHFNFNQLSYFSTFDSNNLLCAKLSTMLLKSHYLFFFKLSLSLYVSYCSTGATTAMVWSNTIMLLFLIFKGSWMSPRVALCLSQSRTSLHVDSVEQKCKIGVETKTKYCSAKFIASRRGRYDRSLTKSI